MKCKAELTATCLRKTFMKCASLNNLFFSKSIYSVKGLEGRPYEGKLNILPSTTSFLFYVEKWPFYQEKKNKIKKK